MHPSSPSNCPKGNVGPFTMYLCPAPLQLHTHSVYTRLLPHICLNHCVPNFCYHSPHLSSIFASLQLEPTFLFMWFLPTMNSFDLTWNVYMPTWDPVAPPALHHTSSTHLDILCPHRTLSARSLRHLSRSSSPISAHKSRTSAPNPQLQSLAYVWCDTRWSPNRRPWAPLHPCHKFTWSWI